MPAWVALVRPGDSAGLVVTVALATFVLAAGYRIHLPGLYYDEALFVNGALGGVSDDFVHRRVLGVPFMLFPYIGALKAWVFYPVFQVAGVSVATIRWPAILLALVTLVVLHGVARRLVGPWWAAGSAWLMATDPAFVYTSRLDWGPVVLMNLCKAVALAGDFMLVDARDATAARRAAWLLAVALVLGFFDKLNFAWLIIGVAVATTVAYRREAARVVLAHRRALVAPAATFLVAFSAMAVWLMAPVASDAIAASAGGQGWWARLRQVVDLFRATLSGEAVYGFVFGGVLDRPGWTSAVSAALVAAALAVLAARRPPSGSGGDNVARAFVFSLILFVAVFAQMVATPQAGGAHHVMMLFPLWHLLPVLAAVLLTGQMRHPSTRRVVTAVAATTIVATAVSQADVLRQYTRALRNDGAFTRTGSPAVYALAEHLRGRDAAAAAAISTDWGIHMPLFALASPTARLKYVDAWPAFTGPGSEPGVAGLLGRPADQGPLLVVTHAPGAEVFAGTRDTAIALTRRLGRPTRLEATIVHGHEAVFEVHVIDPASGR